MPQNITALSIDGFSFDSSNFILAEIQGIEFPTVRLPRFNLPGSSGGFISNALYGERSIRIKGYINAPDGKSATFMNNRTTFINTFAYKRDIYNNLLPQILTMTTSNGQTLTTSVYVDGAISAPFPADQIEWVEFLITLVAPDPNLYSTVQSVTTINLAAGGGMAVPAAVPFNISAGSGGSGVLNNTGGNIVYPTITLTAPLNTPFLTNFNTNLFLKLNTNLIVGQNPLVINCAAQTITQGANDVTSIKSIDSNYFYLMSGNNNIGFSAASGSGQASISFYPNYLGI